MCTSIVQQTVLRKLVRKEKEKGKEKHRKSYLTGDDGESVQILKVYDMQGIGTVSDHMLASKLHFPELQKNYNYG